MSEQAKRERPGKPLRRVPARGRRAPAGRRRPTPKAESDEHGLAGLIGLWAGDDTLDADVRLLYEHRALATR